MNPSLLVSQLEKTLDSERNITRKNAILMIKEQIRFFIQSNENFLEKSISKELFTQQEKNAFYSTTEPLVIYLESLLPKLKPTITGKIFSFFFDKSGKGSDKNQDNDLYRNLQKFINTLKVEKLFLKTEEEFTEVPTIGR